MINTLIKPRDIYFTLYGLHKGSPIDVIIKQASCIRTYNEYESEIEVEWNNVVYARSNVSIPDDIHDLYLDKMTDYCEKLFYKMIEEQQNSQIESL